MKQSLIVILFFSLIGVSLAQDLAHHDSTDVHNIKEWFGKGHMHGHFRNYLMATINKEGLNDYITNATGGALAYTTSDFKGFEIGVKGIFTYNVYDNDLLRLDEQAQRYAKWETELYDLTRPREKKDLDRLEELYIKYHFGRSFLSYGKLDINKGPFLFRRDGRMKPFVYHGFWSEVFIDKNSSLNLGWIHGVSPRGITEWFSINEAIGILNNGLDCTGHSAHYHDTAQTKGMAIADYRVEFPMGIHIQIADYWLHHMMNTVWMEAEYKWKSFTAGMQLVNQTAMGYQSELDVNQRYFDPQYASTTVAFRIAWEQSHFSTNINYLRGLDEGRFLFPKELGRDNFYTSIPRMWMDGFGRANAYSINMEWHTERWNIKTSGAYIAAPDRVDHISNKYRKNSFAQCNVQFDYSFKDNLEGLRLSFLYVARPFYDQSGLSQADIFYNYDLHHFNFITNIDF